MCITLPIYDLCLSVQKRTFDKWQMNFSQTVKVLHLVYVNSVPWGVSIFFLGGMSVCGNMLLVLAMLYMQQKITDSHLHLSGDVGWADICFHVKNLYGQLVLGFVLNFAPFYFKFS